METDYLIVGGGVAGTTAAETIRRYDAQGSIILISQESEPLYNRILLPYFIKGEKTKEQLYIRKREDYDNKKIQVLWGKRIINGSPNQATLGGNKTIGFKKAVLAYSGDLRKLGGPGLVHYLRTIANAERIKEAIERSTKAVVVGDSFIALEFLGVLIKRGAPGQVVIPRNHFLEGKISTASAVVIENYLTSHNITIINNTKVAEVLGSESTCIGLTTEDGRRIEADFCGAGIGLVFDFALAKQFGARTAKGIVTDAYLKSSPNIWAAGDIAEFDDQLLGTQHMLGNWVHAMESGRIAGGNAALRQAQGKPNPYQTISSYSTRTLGIPVAMAGDVTHPNNQTVTEQTHDGIAEIFVRDGRTVGAVMINMPTVMGKVLMAIRAKKPWIG